MASLASHGYVTTMMRAIARDEQNTKTTESRKEYLTSLVFGSETMKYPTIPLNITINGVVTNEQNGQHGPATTIGLPSLLSSRKNIDPTRRAQQQKRELKISIEGSWHFALPPLGTPEGDPPLRRRSASARSRSHLTETAYLITRRVKYIVRAEGEER